MSLGGGASSRVKTSSEKMFVKKAKAASKRRKKPIGDETGRKAATGATLRKKSCDSASSAISENRGRVAALASKLGLGGGKSGRAKSLARGRAPSEVKPPISVRDVVKSKAFRAAILVLAFVMVGGGLGAGARGFWNWMTHSPRFAIREIVVRTEDKVSEVEVTRLANLNLGDNIFSFHLRECVEAIEIHPWVRRASVMRELPDRVIVEVSERQPVALVGLASLYYVDGEGEVFKKVLPEERMDYPIFTGIALRDLVEDKESVEPLIGLGLEVLDVAEGSVIFSPDHISEVHLDRAYGATMVRASDGLRVRLGRGDLDKKWERLEHALIELGSESTKVAELDLNFEGRVTVRLKDGYRWHPKNGSLPKINIGGILMRKRKKFERGSDMERETI